jgi:hypothetical protein
MTIHRHPRRESRMGSAHMIAAAVTATERVQEEVLKTFNALTGFCSEVNGFGVFSEPLRQRACLAAAREAIERAEKIMQETAWPASEDYK